MPSQTIALELHLLTNSPENLEHFGLDLQHELRELPEVTVSTTSAAAPEGTKSGGGVDWTLLMVTLAAGGGVLTALIGLIQSSLNRERKVRVVMDGDELEVSGLELAQQQALVDAWIARQRVKLSQRG